MDAQLFARNHVDTVNKPEWIRYSGNNRTQEELIHREEDCIGITVGSHHGSCGFLCADCRSHWAAATHARRARPAPGARVCVDRRLSPLGGRTLCLDSGPLGASTPSGCPLGCPQVGASRRPLGDAGRTLALIRNTKHEKAGRLPRFFMPFFRSQRLHLPRLFFGAAMPKAIGPTAGDQLISKTSMAEAAAASA
jgi:hypothetical protein